MCLRPHHHLSFIPLLSANLKCYSTTRGKRPLHFATYLSKDEEENKY